MNRFRTLIGPSFVLLLWLTSCDSPEPLAKPGEDQGGKPPTNRIDIPATVRSNLGITFAKVERRRVAETLRVPGAFELLPGARRDYHAILSSHIRYQVSQFDQVDAGETLFEFQSPEWQKMQSRIDLARASLDRGKAKLEALQVRIDALANANVKRADLQSEVIELRAERATQEAELTAALMAGVQVLNSCLGPNSTALDADDLLVELDVNGRSIPRYRTIDWIEVKARNGGVVESLNVTDGAFADGNTLVMKTVDPEMIRFRTRCLQSDLARFGKSPNARIVPDQDMINEGIWAELKVGLDADPRQRTATLFAQPSEQADWSRPGVAAFLEVETSATSGIVLAIPRSAVVKDGVTHVFFKRDPLDPNKAIRVEADLGVNDGRWIEVKSEVGPEDEVVLDGAYELKLASSQSGINQKGGHFHADGTFHAEED